MAWYFVSAPVAESARVAHQPGLLAVERARCGGPGNTGAPAAMCVGWSDHIGRQRHGWQR